jgi:hypothetical protein
MTVDTDPGSIDWGHSVAERLREDSAASLRVDRSGYVAFIRYRGRGGFRVWHRHYHEEESRTEDIDYTALMIITSRFETQAEIVEMPELDSVEVTLDGV